MIKNYYFLAAVILHITSSMIQAQQKKFGDVSKSVLEMEIYEKDSTADAVVLFDVGEVFVDEKLEVRFKRHVRIKVLTDNGLESGNISIGYRPDDPEQDIRKISAESYYLDESGSMKKNKLGRRDKFDNEVSENWSEIKFTIPGLKKGSVFDYSYEMVSESPVDIPDWYFQSEYPTVWSEYRLNIPEWFNYLVYNRGFHPFTVNTSERYNDVALFKNGARLDYQGTEYHYIMKDAPGIENEPFMKAKIDYYSQIRFQLSNYEFPGEFPENVLNTWPLLVKAVYESDNFGKRLKTNPTLKNLAKALTIDSETDLEKMIAIYEHISSVMDWNERYALFVDQNLEDLYEIGTGNSSDINLLLTQTLREAGLQADPVILSTRNNGEIVDIYPITNQFNHTIVRVIINGESYLLDGKNEYRPYNLLPASTLNGNGLVINKDQEVEWISLENKDANKVTNIINLTISEDGNINGTLQSYNEGFFSYEKRESIFNESAGSNEILKNIASVVFKNNENIKVDTSTVLTDESNKFSFSTSFSFENDINNGIMYLQPSVSESIYENPFKLKERTYPVDFEYTFYKTLITNYVIPNGWEVEEHPESKQYNLGDGGTYRRIFKVSGNILSVRDDFLIGKTRFIPEEYSFLKDLYEGISQDNAELIVIKKVQ